MTQIVQYLIKEVAFVVKNLLTKKKKKKKKIAGPDGFRGEFYHAFKEVIPSLHRPSFRKQKRRREHFLTVQARKIHDGEIVTHTAISYQPRLAQGGSGRTHDKLTAGLILGATVWSLQPLWVFLFCMCFAFSKKRQLFGKQTAFSAVHRNPTWVPQAD